ncbi:DEAD/DEAH box helicase [Eubacteriales bacterium OttesenSCG-928-A19]|nr:DEAD/DEAH box helicase [Eubacteriales bacterium OttesenSCG-928-A19]
MTNNRTRDGTLLDEEQLHPYQAFCVDFIEEHPACGIFLDMGLGKTAIALTAISHLLYDSYDVSRVLIIAPLRVARDTWIGELEKWTHLQGLRMERIIGSPKERVAALSRRAELYIINRENVVWLVKHYEGRRLPFDMLVIDELSSFKNAHAKRFMALKRVIGQFQRVVGLTGTPAPNGLEDLWPQMFLLDRGKRLGRTVRSYLDMFFTVPNSWLPYKRELKPGAEQDIYGRLADICVSMRATDHIQMPERVDNLVELSLSPREEKLYKQMERDMLLPYADGDVLALNAATLAGKLLQLANGAVYDEFHNVRVIHDRKLDALEDLIEAANGKPVLVLYTFKHDLQRIQERLGKWSTECPTGVRKLEASQDMADWNEGKIQVAATQPASTGHGLNLQHGGSTIIWFGLNWSLELYEQANARLWRQGQKDTVVIHHLVVKGTMDEQVMRALHGKAAGQNELLAAVKARIGGIQDVGT